jgi:hypothetical protein
MYDAALQYSLLFRTMYILVLSVSYVRSMHVQYKRVYMYLVLSPSSLHGASSCCIILVFLLPSTLKVCGN